MDYNKCLREIIFNIKLHNSKQGDYQSQIYNLEEYHGIDYYKKAYYEILILQNFISHNNRLRNKWIEKKRQITKPFLELQLDNFMCKDVRNIVIEYLISN